MRMEIEDWRAGGQHVRCDVPYRSHRIFVRVAGAGEPLLLIHGFPAGSWVWHRIWPELTERFRVVAPDLLGFGFSDKPADVTYTIARQADIVEALLDILEIPRCHVLAHAYGDSVAQELLARDLGREGGARLLSLSFLNGGIFPEANRRTGAQRLALTGLAPLLGRVVGVPYTLFRRSFCKVFGPDTRPGEAELRAFWRLACWEGGAHVMVGLMRYQLEREVHGERWVAALHEARVPMQLILGRADPISGDQAGHWRAALPDQELHELERAVGHYPQFEDPEGVLRAFLAFHDRRPHAASA